MVPETNLPLLSISTTLTPGIVSLVSSSIIRPFIISDFCAETLLINDKKHMNSPVSKIIFFIRYRLSILILLIFQNRGNFMYHTSSYDIIGILMIHYNFLSGRIRNY